MSRTAPSRRPKQSFPIQLGLRWKLTVRRKERGRGTGSTLALASNWFHCVTDRELPVGAGLELFIEWPALLHQVTPLQLIATGRIVHSMGTEVTVQVSRHEFRTRAGAAAQGC